jgi:hypothetical protein
MGRVIPHPGGVRPEDFHDIKAQEAADGRMRRGDAPS